MEDMTHILFLASEVLNEKMKIWKMETNKKNGMRRKKKMKEKRKFEFLNLYKVKSLVITFFAIC